MAGVVRRRFAVMPAVVAADVPIVFVPSLVSAGEEDEQGGEVLEYALIAGLIVVAAIAVIGAVGTKGRGGGLGSYGTGVGGLGKKGERDVNVATGPATVMGSIDKELIRKVIQDHAAQIRYCYETQLAINPRLQGKVAIKWIINA